MTCFVGERASLCLLSSMGIPVLEALSFNVNGKRSLLFFKQVLHFQGLPRKYIKIMTGERTQWVGICVAQTRRPGFKF